MANQPRKSNRASKRSSATVRAANPRSWRGHGRKLWVWDEAEAKVFPWTARGGRGHVAGQNWGHCVAQRPGNHKREQWKGTLFAYPGASRGLGPPVERVFSQFASQIAKVLARSRVPDYCPRSPKDANRSAPGARHLTWRSLPFRTRLVWLNEKKARDLTRYKAVPTRSQLPFMSSRRRDT